MGKGKKKKKGNSSSPYQTNIVEVKTGNIEFLATVYVKGVLTTSTTALDKYDGTDVAEKINTAIKKYLESRISGILGIGNVKFKPKESKDDHFLAEYSMKLAEKMVKDEEDKHTYIGEVVCDKNKKISIFNYPEIKEAWKQQRDIWGTWKEFVKVFLDDIESEEVDLENGDIPGSYVIVEEMDIRKKLLRDFIEDSEKLGFVKINKEPQN